MPTRSYVSQKLYAISIDWKFFWSVGDELEQSMPYITDQDEDVKVYINDSIPLTNCKKVIISVEKDRFSSLDDHKLVIKGDCITEKVMLEAIHAYYTRDMTDVELKEISKTKDSFDYYKLAIKALKKKESLARFEIMGDCTRFEGVDFVKFKDGVAYYNLALGS